MATAFQPPANGFKPVPGKLDILDGVPDVDMDGLATALGMTIPVEDFWGDYVDNLGAQAQDEFLDGSGDFGPTMDNYNPLDPMPVEELDQPGMLKGRLITTGLDLPHANGTTPQSHMPQIPSTSQNSAYGLGPLPLGQGPQLGSGSGDSGGGSQHMDEHDPEGQSGRSTRGRARAASLNTKTKRNAKQQIQNKQAQQRYRERRKERFGQMEAAIEELSEQVKDLATVQAQNSMLQGKASELEQALHEKEAEIERLRSALIQQSAPTSSNGSIEAIAHAEAHAEEGDDEAPSAVHEADIARFAASRETHIQKLREFVDRHNLRNVDPLGVGVPESILKELTALVSEGCLECQKAMRAEGIRVLELMSRSVEQITRFNCQKKKEKWTGILQLLRLTPPQQEQLLAVRKMHLERLRATYEERQALNLQAMSLMLPPHPRLRPEVSVEGPNGELDSKLACMTLNDYSHCARHHVDLNGVLDKIKVNLRLEQKNVLEMSFVVMGRILSCIQAAVFLVEIYPWHVDCLALTNVLAHSLKRQDTGGIFGSRTLSADERASSDNSEGCPFADVSG